MNDIVSSFCLRRNLPVSEAAQVIRDTNFRAKSTWVLRLLGAPPINDEHLKKITRSWI